MVVDQYDGEVFDDYTDAMFFAEHIGFAELFHRGARAASALDDGFLTVGFSNGGCMAALLDAQRPAAGAVLLGGVISLATLGGASWPQGVPAQVHTMTEDPYREQAEIEAFAAEVAAAGAQAEVFDYPGSGHLFTDPSLATEYDEEAGELLWTRVLEFCARVG